MMYTKNQPQSLLSSGEEAFLSVLPYMGMAAILFSGTEAFEKIYQHPFDRRPHVKSCEKISSGFRAEEEDV